jgi:hypothetical protein
MKSNKSIVGMQGRFGRVEIESCFVDGRTFPSQAALALIRNKTLKTSKSLPKLKLTQKSPNGLVG